MARIISSGFELGTISAECFSSSGAASIDSSIFRSGSRSLKVVPPSGVAAWAQPGGGGTSPSFRVYVRVTVLPASTRLLLGTIAANQCNVRLTSTGALELYTNTTLIGTSSLLLDQSGVWYCVEVNCGDTSTLYIDDVSAVSGSSVGTADMVIQCGASDTVAATYTAYFDDAVIHTSAGTYIGGGKLALLVPTSLNAAGGWVEGDGAGTANMAAAVATIPPPGLASANETNATNIESPTNSATDNCDMNMTTYAAAGVGPFDTINGVAFIVRHGEDIATGTKAAAATIVSNPAQASEDTFSFGDDAGAHGAEASNWKTARGTLQTGAVTLTTAPVLRVGKRTATSRVVCVDFMGIYVDYTPRQKAAVRTDNLFGLGVNQAVNRSVSI